MPESSLDHSMEDGIGDPSLDEELTVELAMISSFGEAVHDRLPVEQAALQAKRVLEYGGLLVHICCSGSTLHTFNISDPDDAASVVLGHAMRNGWGGLDV